MTRDELARSIVKLPGFGHRPQQTYCAVSVAQMFGPHSTIRDRTKRCDRGIVWHADRDGCWWPDLTDAATGGCLQELAGWPPILSLFEVDEGRWVCVLSHIGYHISQRTGIGATRAEAVSIAICVWALALGRWPGGGS